MRRRIPLVFLWVVSLAACGEPTPESGGDAEVDAAPESDASPETDAGDAGDSGSESDADVDAGTDACVGSCGGPTCTDGEQNGNETGVDCGGSCAACPPPVECTIGSECASTHCIDHVCVDPPTAGFTLTAGSGEAPVATTAISTAIPGSAAIVTTEYDWDEGEGFEFAADHGYLVGGTFTITQRVTDENDLTATTTHDVVITEFVPVRWNAADSSPDLALSDDRLTVESGSFRGGVRTDRSIAAGSGVFYFEAKRLQSPSFRYGIGVGTALADKSSSIGSSAESVGVITSGGIDATGSSCATPTAFFPGADQDVYGFVVDYRGTSPIVHVLLADGGGALFVRQSCTLATTAPVFAFYEGERHELRPQLRLNVGNDTTNHPFHFAAADVRAALTAASASSAADALVLGWGQTRARPADAAPVLTTSGDLSVGVGTLVNLTASAIDATDGSLTSAIEWLDLAHPHFAMEVGAGGAYSFTPTELGRHPIVVRVTDSFENVATHTIVVNVTGTLPQFDPVALAQDPGTGSGVSIGANGLGARFDGFGKQGVRANQAIYGRFWYFEATRQVGPSNMGVGLVVTDGNLNPYDFQNVPYSCSVNALGGTWRNLIWQTNSPTASPTYGFAVDYRGANPIVYVLVEGGVHDVLVLDDVWTPIHPMVYANPTDSVPPALDWIVNFGTSPFVFDPAAALAAENVDTAGFELGWGDANVP